VQKDKSAETGWYKDLEETQTREGALVFFNNHTRFGRETC